MDSLDLNHGTTGLLKSIAGLLLANIVVILGSKAWEFYQRNRAPTGQEFRNLTEALKETNKAIAKQSLVVDEMWADIHRIYLFLKAISGDRWGEYFKKVREMEAETKITKGDL